MSQSKKIKKIKSVPKTNILQKKVVADSEEKFINEMAFALASIARKLISST